MLARYANDAALAAVTLQILLASFHYACLIHEELESQKLFLVRNLNDVDYLWLGVHRLYSKRILLLLHGHLTREYAVGVHSLLQHLATLVEGGQNRSQSLLEWATCLLLLLSRVAEVLAADEQPQTFDKIFGMKVALALPKQRSDHLP